MLMARGRFVRRVQERVYFIGMLSLTVTFLFADQNLMAPNVRRPHPPGQGLVPRVWAVLLRALASS